MRLEVWDKKKGDSAALKAAWNIFVDVAEELSFEIQKRRAELSQAGPLEGGILVSMSL